MKKIYLFICLIAFSSLRLALAQSTVISDDTVKMICSGKWYLESLELKGKKSAVPDSVQKKTWIIFKENGVMVNSDMDTSYVGKWIYFPRKRTIRTLDKEIIRNQTILKVSYNYLSVSFTDKFGVWILNLKK